MTNTKSFEISKGLVWKAWKRIKANGGSYGVDAVSIEEFEININMFISWSLEHGVQHAYCCDIPVY